MFRKKLPVKKSPPPQKIKRIKSKQTKIEVDIEEVDFDLHAVDRVKKIVDQPVREKKVKVYKTSPKLRQMLFWWILLF